MSVKDKMIARILTCPRDYTYSEAKALAAQLGYQEKNKGSTSGSRVLFYRERDKRKIMLHKPHPRKELLSYQIKQLIDILEQEGLL